MKYELTQHAYDVVTTRGIKMEWIAAAVDSPAVKVAVSSVELHFFKSIEEAENRCLKVVVNPMNLKIITTYFDRNMRKRGCQ